MTLTAAISIAITALQAAPGFVSTLSQLVADIKGNAALSDDDKASLLRQAKADVDAENVAVQAAP